MAYRNEFAVEAGAKVRLEKVDTAYTGKHLTPEEAKADIDHNLERLRKAQYLLYASASRSLLVVLQGMDASGKDGTIGHIFSGTNPQGVRVAKFKTPTAIELSHDFLWRVHLQAPAKGEIVIFNRSHYEDVLVVRVHKLAPKAIWSERYDLINSFEASLAEAGTKVLKFYLHISPKEQLERFRERLDNPAKHWKIDESDYTERERWGDYIEAYEAALSRTSTNTAPWYIIPSDRKWFRNLAISEIVADTIEEMGLTLPPPHVDIEAMRRKYHAEVKSQASE